MNIDITITVRKTIKRICFAGCICLFLWIPALSMVELPKEMHELILSSIKNVCTNQFKLAENDAKRICKKYPDHPAGYFFYAVILNSFMEYLQSEKYEIDFYRYCDLAILKGEEKLEKIPDDPWVKFFMAGANGLKGTYESRYEKWITAFKHGWRGVVLFRELLDSHPDMQDVYYGIATYDYWRSAKTRMLWWLPGVEDKREEAIKALQKMRTTGLYVKESAALNLIEILLNENQFTAALEVTTSLQDRFPESFVCNWGTLRAQIGLQEFEKAEQTLEKILTHINSASFDNNYNIALYHYYLVKVCFERKKYDNCLKAYTKMKDFKLSLVSQKRFEDFYKDGDSIARKANRALGKSK